MRTTLRVTCSKCGVLTTMVLTTPHDRVVDEVKQQIEDRYRIHDPGMRDRTLRECGGTVTVTRTDHKPRGTRKAVSS